LYIYLTLLRLYQQSHRLKTGQPEPLGRHIRLMVDVLLTMNEAFRYAAGASFLFARPHHKRGSAARCLVRKT
jgi:hypothetical protein